MRWNRRNIISGQWQRSSPLEAWGLCLRSQRQSHRGIHDPAWILCGRHKRGVQIYEKALPLRYADGLRDKILDPGCGDRADGVRSGGVSETEMRNRSPVFFLQIPKFYRKCRDAVYKDT